MTQQAPVLNSVEANQMTLMEHLNELRVRLMWVVTGLFAGTLIAFVFARPLLEFIRAPLADGTLLIAIGPTDTIINVFKISFMVGASLAMPLIVYHLVAFAAPGLYPHEKRALLLSLPFIFALFLAGMAFAFYVMLPVALAFLQSFFGDLIEQTWTFDRYVGFITRVVFWIGVSFETPIVLAFLARTGIVSGPQLLRFWRHAIVLIAIVAAIITPTIDPVNMSIVMAPLIVLYFFSVGLAYMLYRPRTPRDFSQEPFIEE
ncbi:MAG TPA: twin-arginine translocase subunit TatC [Caldilineaceae bacterium]|nr:twin-arginine translocase subunit TatC [Caldilineaceae bacterium]